MFTTSKMSQRFSKAAAVSAVALFVALPAKAGLLLEPYLGYGMGTVEQSTGAATKSDVSGVVVGGRVGVTLPIFFGGLDYSMMNGTTKVTSGGSGTNDLSTSSLFVVAGASLPLIRGYAGYGFLNDWTSRLPGGDSTASGSAIKVGAGFTGLPFVSLNFEIMQSTFTKVKFAGVESSYDAKATSYTLSVSAPFDL